MLSRARSKARAKESSVSPRDGSLDVDCVGVADRLGVRRCLGSCTRLEGVLLETPGV